MQSELGLAMVGSGFMGRLHSLAFTILPSFYPDLPRVRRRVIVDISEASAARGADSFGYDAASVDWRSAIDRDDVDIVDIVTPNDSHRAVAEYALSKGKHVICEKPIALTAAEAREMARQAARANVVTMAAFNYRKCLAIKQAKKLVDEGAIGEVLTFRGLYLQDWAMPDGLPWSWRFGKAQAGSGSLGDIGSHALDLAVYLVGDISEVVSMTRTVVPTRPRPDVHAVFSPTAAASRANDMVPVDVDDCTMAMFRFANGALGTLEATRFASGRKNYLDFELSGTKGSLAFNWERSTELLFCSADDRQDVQGFRTIVTGPLQPDGESFWPIPGIGTAYIETQVSQLGDFVRAVREGGRVDTDFAHGCRIQEVMEAMLASAQDRKWHPVRAEASESRAG